MVLLGGLRAATRACLIVGSTSGLFVVYLTGCALRRDPDARARFRNGMIQRWARLQTRLLGIRIAVEGEPPQGSLVVSNHLSYVDILVLGSQFPCIFVSKAEVADWPGMGRVARSAGTIFVDRERKRELPRTAEQIATELERGSAVVLFPEGTSSPGAELLPFRPSLLAPAASTGCPVAYAALRYSAPEGHPPASESVCWWGGMTFGGHVLGLLRLPYIDAQVRFGPEPVRETDRKVLAARLWHAVRNLFEPTS